MKTTGPGKVSIIKADGTVVELGTFDGISYQVTYDLEPPTSSAHH